jgi:acyl-CoA thioesterase II
MVTTQAMLVELLDLERIESTSSQAAAPDENLQRVFGGQVAGQALVAAGRAVPPDRPAHSLPAYFIRPGDPVSRSSLPVDRIRDGRSFTTRRVVAVQNRRAILALSASFQVAETGPEYQSLIPGGARSGDRARLAGAPEAVRRPSPGPLAPAAPGRGPLRRRSAVAGTGRWWTTGATHHGVAASQRDPARRPLLHVCAVTYASDLTLLDARQESPPFKAGRRSNHNQAPHRGEEPEQGYQAGAATQCSPNW